MKITIVGAAGGEVTGSAYCVRTMAAGVLMDCGLFQGGKKSEALNRPPTGPKQKLDAVLLTHGHLDPTGRLPLLAKRGHTAPVYATPATIEMTSLILRDSAKIQTNDDERRNRKRQRAGEPPQEPLYTSENAEAIIQRLQPVPYQQTVAVAPGIQAVWAESGHDGMRLDAIPRHLQTDVPTVASFTAYPLPTLWAPCVRQCWSLSFSNERSS